MDIESIAFCRWSSSCASKVRFSHAKHAQMRIRQISHSGGFGVGRLVSYRCRFCSGFHIGHFRCTEGMIGVGEVVQ